jgi:NAD-dependent DNA ligase
MISLGDAFDEKELIEFDQRIKRMLNYSGNIEYSAEPKIRSFPKIFLLYGD